MGTVVGPALAGPTTVRGRELSDLQSVVEGVPEVVPVVHECLSIFG